MEYGLTRLVLGCAAFVRLTEAEYAQIREKRDLLLEILYVEQKFDLLLDNYLEFETDLLQSCAREMVRGVSSWTEFQDETNQLNRRVVNLLSACRLYLDHACHHMQNVDYLVPGIRSKIKATTSSRYDALLGYRVMEALRNYVQHRGYPIHGITLELSKPKDGTGVVYAVTPYLAVKEVAADGKFKAAVLKELQELGETIDLKPLVRQYVAGLSEVHLEIRNALITFTAEADTLIRGAMTRYRDAEPTDASVIGLAAVQREGDVVHESIALFEDVLNYRKTFERKNRNLSNLASRYVTSESIGK
jgi:hypothetical protein